VQGERKMMVVDNVVPVLGTDFYHA
jgi:hypothetical protein